MAKKRRRRVSNSNRRGMAGIAVVVVTLLIVLLFQSQKLEKKNAVYASQEESLQAQLEQEQARADELETLPEYTQSREFIEKTAREKFGLVYPDEIVFKAKE